MEIGCPKIHKMSVLFMKIYFLVFSYTSFVEMLLKLGQID